MPTILIVLKYVISSIPFYLICKITHTHTQKCNFILFRNKVSGSCFHCTPADPPQLLSNLCRGRLLHRRGLLTVLSVYFYTSCFRRRMDEGTELSLTIAQIVRRLKGSHLHSQIEKQAKVSRAVSMWLTVHSSLLSLSECR